MKENILLMYLIYRYLNFKDCLPAVDLFVIPNIRNSECMLLDLPALHAAN